MERIVLVTGGFDPLHSGHIQYLKAAKELGDRLIVGVNSDAWLSRKKGKPFMPMVERIAVLQELKCVDEVVYFNDNFDYDGSSIKFIQETLELHPESEIIFANGGDRTDKNIPEMVISNPRLKFIFGVGGTDKTNSSSWILQEWKAPKTPRPWGYYRVLHEHDQILKVKELTVDPGKQLSMQRHSTRGEHWVIAEGQATVYTINTKSDLELHGVYNPLQHVHISINQWHQLCNETSDPLKIIEIQYGTNCIEDDIERLK
jgi:cytidyltransferase-like protein